MKRALVAALAAMLCVTTVTAISPAEIIGAADDPFTYFNLYSLGDIGSASSPYQGQVQGRLGAAGNVAMSSFTLLNLPSQTGWALYVGGSANLGGTYLGGIDVGGDVALGGVGISGGVQAGGSVAQFGGGVIGGSVLAGGSARLDQTMTVYGQTLSNQSYRAVVDHQAVNEYFLKTSTDIGQMLPTGEFTEEWGRLTLAGGAGVNVVTIFARDLREASHVTIDAPDGAVVYINVPDAEVSLDWTGWNYEGGIGPRDVLLNLPYALLLELSGTNAVNILAPLAATDFQSGKVAGSLVVGSIQGNGQVDRGGFGHGGTIPEPASMLLLACGAAAALPRRRRAARPPA
jgi:choice-of-anchor A domain-containing protein